MFRLLTSAPRPEELTGALDLVSRYGLREYYEMFRKKPPVPSITERRYLFQVAGDVEVRKGEGMDLIQVVQGSVSTGFTDAQIKPFDLVQLHGAFSLREAGSISLSEEDKGFPTTGGILQDEPKNKRHKKKHKKSKHKCKEIEKMMDGKGGNGEKNSYKGHKKKRKHMDDSEDPDGSKHMPTKHMHTLKLSIPVSIKEW